MRKRTTAADHAPLRVVVVTLDQHLASAAQRACAALHGELPQLTLAVHGATEWGADTAKLETCLSDIASADILVVTMLFMDEHIDAVLPALEARRAQCDALVACMSAERVTALTKLGKLAFGGLSGGVFGLLRRLRPKRGSSAGAAQLQALKRLPKLLRLVPGRAQDLRTYFLVLLYWLSGSEQNLAELVRLLVSRYADGPRRGARTAVREPAPPREYPDVGLYHPRLPDGITTDIRALPRRKSARGRVGVLVMRSYVLAGNTNHYDAVIGALEAQGLDVVPAFASGLDARAAVDTYFVERGRASIDALVSLTGFSLVGGPAFNDAAAAAAMLEKLGVPYLAAHAVEFQSLAAWQGSELGLTPLEATLMVAIPELDGATGPIVIGGRGSRDGSPAAHDMQGDLERAETLAARVSRLVALRATPRAQRKLGIVLFNFPPNAGNVGTAAFLAVFESLFNTLRELERAGYDVAVPESVDALRTAILGGNSSRYGTPANVHARVAAEDYVRREPWLAEIEAQWGPAPGRQQSDGASLFVLGARFGNVLVGLQPAFGYEGDPMRLLFERGFAPTHAFSAFYRYLREDFGADAVLHFGTHGALEFMPGKQTGLSRDCWPDRLLRDLPNFYLYAANNPSEATIAKRRSAATLVSYLTPPVVAAGLHRDLGELKELVDRHRGLPPTAAAERRSLEALIGERAGALELLTQHEGDTFGAAAVTTLLDRLRELEQTLIPHGLHVLGEPQNAAERRTILAAAAAQDTADTLSDDCIAAIADGATAEQIAVRFGLGATPALERLVALNRELARNVEIDALLHALDGRFVPPAPSGDLLRTPEILPTGRNPHGFDPFKLPSAFAVLEGKRHADQLLGLARARDGALPESVALVLWGSDNLKTGGNSIGLALALLGAEPSYDAYGRLRGAVLAPLGTLGRPRIDVVVTLSGIFRDLLPLQTAMLAEAAYLAATADEPLEHNFVRKHALAYAADHGCDIDTAALRVFSNAAGAYGANVNHLIENGRWQSDDELATTFAQRKSFAYSRKGRAEQQRPLLENLLGGCALAYQALESVELGVTSLDQYFDTLGGIGRVVKGATGEALPVYIGDQSTGDSRIRTLSEQIALETHTRLLNPTWYEGLLEHGYEGVRQIQAHVTNTFGWSATTEQVEPWVYDKVAATYVTDDEMRRRLAALNPTATAQIAARLREAHERSFWSPDEATLAALARAEDELEDRIEGINVEVAA